MRVGCQAEEVEVRYKQPMKEDLAYALIHPEALALGMYEDVGVERQGSRDERAEQRYLEAQYQDMRRVARERDARPAHVDIHPGEVVHFNVDLSQPQGQQLSHQGFPVRITSIVF